MMGWFVRATCMLVLMLPGLPAWATPLGYKGSVMVMGDYSPKRHEAFANYAFTSRDAVGVSALRMRSDDDRQVRTAGEVTYTRLVQRWNMEAAQANVWFLGGVGAVRGNTFEGARALVSPGMQLDYETTRLYASATGRLFRANGINHDSAAVRAGFSFYEVDYDEPQPWFVLEVKRTRRLSEKNEVTPMLRVIHKRLFVELGVNTSSEVRLNLMYTH